MDGFKMTSIPAFGNWNYVDCLPITHYFQSSTELGLLDFGPKDGDLYGETCINYQELHKPLAINGSCIKRCIGDNVLEHGWVYEIPKVAPCNVPKAVDEDLYQISEEHLHSKAKRLQKKGWSFFGRCLQPICLE